MHAAQKPKSKLKFVLLDKESNMNTLYFLRICSKEDLSEKAQDIEVTIPVRKSEEKQHYFDDDDCFYYHSWRNNVVIAFGTLSSFLT